MCYLNYIKLKLRLKKNLRKKFVERLKIKK